MLTGSLCLRAETSDGYCEECNRLFLQKHNRNFFESYNYTRRYFPHGIKVRNKSRRNSIYSLSISNIESREKVHKEIGFDKPIRTHPQKKRSVTWLRHTSPEIFHISYNLKIHLRTITTSEKRCRFSKCFLSSSYPIYSMMWKISISGLTEGRAPNPQYVHMTAYWIPVFIDREDSGSHVKLVSCGRSTRCRTGYIVRT